MNECAEYRELISAELDGELDAAQQTRLRAHLERCGACHRYCQTLRAVSAALREEPAEPPAALAAAVMAKLAAIEKAPPRRAPRMRRVTPLRWGALAAALLLIAGVGYAATRGDAGRAKQSAPAAQYARMAPAAPAAEAEAAEAAADTADGAAESPEVAGDAPETAAPAAGVPASSAPAATASPPPASNALPSPVPEASGTPEDAGGVQPVASAQRYILDYLPETWETLLDPDAPELTALRETPPDYTPCVEDYTPRGGGWLVSFATTQDAERGSLALLVDGDGTVYGIVSRPPKTA